jgi:hypothetical protein
LEKRSSVYLESADTIERDSSPQWIGALKLVKGRRLAKTNRSIQTINGKQNQADFPNYPLAPTTHKMKELSRPGERPIMKNHHTKADGLRGPIIFAYPDGGELL